MLELSGGPLDPSFKLLTHRLDRLRRRPRLCVWQRELDYLGSWFLVEIPRRRMSKHLRSSPSPLLGSSAGKTRNFVNFKMKIFESLFTDRQNSFWLWTSSLSSTFGSQHVLTYHVTLTSKIRIDLYNENWDISLSFGDIFMGIDPTVSSHAQSSHFHSKVTWSTPNS